jgi:glucan phosphoethanolaminetransferase (alkaline phosphatase superfamily)
MTPKIKVAIAFLGFIVIAFSFRLWLHETGNYEVQGIGASSLFLLFFIFVSVILYQSANHATRCKLVACILALSLWAVWEVIAFYSGVIVPRLLILAVLSTSLFISYKFLEKRAKEREVGGLARL